jgi:hypothetical protein
MGLLDFYTLDLTHAIIIAFSSFMFYVLVNKLDKDQKYKKLCTGVSCFIGIIVSILISYYTIESDVPLTENYFD